MLNLLLEEKTLKPECHMYLPSNFCKIELENEILYAA